jgi:hypothetical protein
MSSLHHNAPTLLLFSALTFLAGITNAAQAQTTCPSASEAVKVALTNPSFSELEDGRIKGWKAIEHRVRGNYVFELDTKTFHSAPSSAQIRQVSTEDFGVLKQETLIPACWKGKLAKLSGYLRTDKALGGGGALVLHVTDGSNILKWNHMNDARVKGTQDWKRYSIELRIPDNGYMLETAVMLEDDGALWVDDLSLEIAP